MPSSAAVSSALRRQQPLLCSKDLRLLGAQCGLEPGFRLLGGLVWGWGVGVRVCVWGHRIMVCVWRSEGLWKLVLSFHHVGPADQAGSSGLGQIDFPIEPSQWSLYLFLNVLEPCVEFHDLLGVSYFKVYKSL